MIVANTDYTGLAALITAVVGAVVALVGVARATARTSDIQAKTNEVHHEVDKADLKLTNEIDRRARNEGALTRLEGTVDRMQQQIVDTITSTSDQREKVTQLLVDCEKRHTEKDAVIHELRGEVRDLAVEVASIKSKVGAE